MKKLIASLLAATTLVSMSVPSFAAFTAAGTEGSANFDSVYKKDVTTPVIAANPSVLDAAVVPDSTYYYVLPSSVTVTQDGTANTAAISSKDLANSDLFKAKYDKSEGAKYIKSIKMIEKDVTSAAGRENVLEVKLVDDMTDKEFKVKFEVTFSAKSKFFDDAANVVLVPSKDLKVFMDEQTIFFGNIKNTDTDATEDAGTGGKYYKPQANEENEIVWEDENDEIAMLSFDADSSTNYYYPKVSTVWNNEDYASMFDGQDAFKREFVGNPAISSTSRAVLNLNVPYINEDDEVTVDEADIIVYQVIDNEPVDITAKGKFMTTDDDKYVFQIKTRELGTYIFAQAPAADAMVDEAPAVDAGKDNPGTGA